ncbi:MAG: AMP-binding protein [Acetobacteraceae bacterium]|nr:AMP-binding protein [Acetobacteraceae bacterium]
MSNVRVVSFGRRLTELAEARPDATVITLARQDGSEDTLSYAALERWSNRVARLLASRGLDTASTLCIGIYNSLEHYAAAYGAWKLGACTLPLSPRMPDIEFRGITGLLDRKLVIADRDDADLRKADITALRDGGPFADTALPDITAHPGKAIGSGGSTGRSKIIVDPNPWARQVGDMMLGAGVGMRPGQVQLVAGPLYHNSPFSWSHYGIFDAHHIVVMERFDAARAMDLIERHGVQFGFLAPTMMMRIVRLPGIDRRDFSSIESIFVTAAPCPAWLKQRWIELTAPEKVMEGYGSSENAGACLIRGDEWLQHPGSVGRPAGCELRILDEDFREVPQGEVGEIFFRPAAHPQPTYQYIGSAPARRTPDGFISVGDLGHVDAEGYLFLSDRRVDLIIRGGANIYPAEVEAALTEHPDIADAAVIGIPHDELGKTVHAIVEPRPGATVAEPALRAWMKQRLTAYKLPESYEFMESLPRDQSGKIRRSQLARERETLKVAS